MALVKQISQLVNDAVKDALGKNAVLTTLDSTDVVSMGKLISQYDAFEPFYKSLTNRIARTVYFVRTYEGRTRSVLRDEHEYGAFIQKVYYTMPDAVDNPTWAIPDAQGNYKQASPYDVEGTVAISSLIYGGKGTWTIEIIRPVEQIKSAFTSPAEMAGFIDGIYITIENSFKLEEERLTALAVNTAMASALQGGKARNLLAEYNTMHPSGTLTVAECLENLDFLKYASKEINLTIDNMGTMSTVYNKAGYATFTTKENLVVEMLSHYASANDMYLQADTFHNELTKLPNFEKVPYWQSSGDKFSFESCSAIKVKHSDLVGGSNETGVVEQGGIICFVHDIENVAAYFGNRRSWELFNQRSDVMVHGEKADKGFAVDNHANGVVFYVAAS